MPKALKHIRSYSYIFSFTLKTKNNQKHTLKKQQKTTIEWKQQQKKKVSLSLFYGTMQNTSGDAQTVLIILKEYLPYLNIPWTYTLWDKQIIIHTLNSLLILFYS